MLKLFLQALFLDFLRGWYRRSKTRQIVKEHLRAHRLEKKIPIKAMIALVNAPPDAKVIEVRVHDKKWLVTAIASAIIAVIFHFRPWM